VSRLRLYALLDAEPEGPLPAGAAGEPLRLVRCGALLAAIGDLDLEGEIAVTPPALAAHDRTVRRLAGAASALLPARFGQSAAGEAELCRLVGRRAAELAGALELVHGCSQMTLRIGRAAGDPPEPVDPDPGAGTAPGSPEPAAQRPGTRYLEDRRRLLASRRELPEVASLRRELAPLVRAERVVRHRGTALLATVYDLVPRPRLDDYRRLVAARAAAEPGRMLALTGPWPPYAFAPGLDPELGEVAAPAGGAAMEAR
jgi:hypothetical protein